MTRNKLSLALGLLLTSVAFSQQTPETKQKSHAQTAQTHPSSDGAAGLGDRTKSAPIAFAVTNTIEAPDSCWISGFDATNPSAKLETTCSEQQLEKWFAPYTAKSLPKTCWPADDAKNKVIVDGKRYVCNSVWTEVGATSHP